MTGDSHFPLFILGNCYSKKALSFYICDTIRVKIWPPTYVVRCLIIREIEVTLMERKEIKIFYSWQSDLPNNKTRGLIQEGISDAIKMLRDTVEIEADRDTQGEYGAPDIVQTIFSKINECDIFIADVSVINKYHAITENGKKAQVKFSPNPNVLLELGYAASVVGWENVICFLNVDYGDPTDFPFDLAHRRLSPYSLQNKTKKEVREYIKNIVVKTVSNLIENGVRVKGTFSRMVVGSFDSEKSEILDELIPFNPTEYYIANCRMNYINKCRELIHRINAIHVPPSEVAEFSNESVPAVPMELGQGRIFWNTDSMSTIPQRICVKESDKAKILKFAKEDLKLELSKDFFELGNLKERKSIYFADNCNTLDGSEEEQEKYNLIKNLILELFQMEKADEYSRSFENYYLFPLALRNLSTVSDDKISIFIDVEGSSAIYPTKNIIAPTLKGEEGIVYELGFVKNFLLMPENSSIKYVTNVGGSANVCISPFKKCGDAEDYENELSKYIAEPQGTSGIEYNFYIDSLRPKETCWVGPIIMIGRDTSDFKFKYFIKSNKSDGSLSGVLHYSAKR